MPVSGSSKPVKEKEKASGSIRPPWVKDCAQASTNSGVPWSLRPTPSEIAAKEYGQDTPRKETKLQSREIKVPVVTEKQKIIKPLLKPVEKREKDIPIKSEKDFLGEKPKLRHVIIDKDKTATQNKENELEIPKLRPVLRKTTKVDDVSETDSQKSYTTTPESVSKGSSSERENVPKPPPPPSSSGAPAPPPPPGLAPPENFKKAPLTEKQQQIIEKLKTRARRRPDWSVMMKEVESGRKLRHVQCNDRSMPIITTKSMTKVSGKFVYETEKANVHNELLHQIQSGIKLRPTKCNDRSKPILEGLRKFRRQMTIEEQIQKSESRAVLSEAGEAAEDESQDEMDDIDKLRDDLQSTKQLLALELRNKEAQERENKRLLSRIANLEAELEREKHKNVNSTNGSIKSSVTDEALVKSLKEDAEEARKVSKELEKKYNDVAEQLDIAKSEIQDQKRQINDFQKKIAQSQGNSSTGNSRRTSEAVQKESSIEAEIEETESESDEDDEKKAEKKAKRIAREVKMLKNKLTKLEEKQAAAKKERLNLREAMKKNQNLLKEENQNFKKLQLEVDKMASMMKEASDDEDDDEEEEESEEDTDSEESDDESESTSSETESESEPENASNDDKKKILEPKVKRLEGRLTALKKGNYLLQANVDRIQDEINKIREKSVTLKADLDSVLTELG